MAIWPDSPQTVANTHFFTGHISKSIGHLATFPANYGLFSIFCSSRKISEKEECLPASIREEIKEPTFPWALPALSGVFLFGRFLFWKTGSGCDVMLAVKNLRVAHAYSLEPGIHSYDFRDRHLFRCLLFDKVGTLFQSKLPPSITGLVFFAFVSVDYTTLRHSVNYVMIRASKGYPSKNSAKTQHISEIKAAYYM